MSSLLGVRCKLTGVSRPVVKLHSCVSMFAQLNKCVVVCGSVLQRGHGTMVMGV